MLNMNTEMCNYDVYPKVILEDREETITVRPLGWHAGFVQGKAYHVELLPRNLRNWPTCTDAEKERVNVDLTLYPDADGCLRFTYTFHGEMPWYIHLVNDDGSRGTKLSFYVLHQDMKGRYPFLGDLHVHTRVSDGREAPAVVCANLRKAGYDFTVISDHYRYYGSLEAIRAYKDLPIDMEIVPGEECHLPDEGIHIVNFGGLYSINSLLDTCIANTEKGTDPEFRAMDPANCPPIIPEDEYRRQVMEIANGLGELPEGVDPFTYAACLWVFDHIREADGMCIFPHPYWIARGQNHVSEAMCEYLFEKHDFDAFELLGGEAYLDQNEFQVFKYLEARAKGLDFPVVGSSDSHGSTPNNSKWNVAQTIVFARQNERREIIDSVKQKYSVAVDNISPQVRLSGDFRFVQYGRFLLDFYFPIHDELCFEEGRLMKEYVCGQNDHALEELARMKGRVARMQHKYFHID